MLILFYRKLHSADSRGKDKESPSKRQVVQPPATTLVVITDSDNQDEGEGTELESSIK